MMGQLQVVNVSNCASHQAACVWTGIVVAWLCVAAEVNDRSEGLGEKKIGCEPCLTLRASASSACWGEPSGRDRGGVEVCRMRLRAASCVLGSPFISRCLFNLSLVFRVPGCISCSSWDRCRWAALNTGAVTCMMGLKKVMCGDCLWSTMTV